MASWVRILIALTICCTSGALAAHRKPQSRVVPSIHGIWACTDKKHYYDQHNFTITKDAMGCDAINTEFSITQPIKRFTKLTTSGWRRGEGDAWEYYGTWKWTAALCELLATKNSLWASVIQNITPAFKCPVAQGSYRMINGTTDFGLLDKLIPGGDKYTWRVEINLFGDRNDLAICLTSGAHFSRVLIKGREPSKEKH